MPRRGLSRRTFLAGAALLAGAACTKERAAAPDAAPRRRRTQDESKGPLTLTPELRQTLAAACARILPSDDGPGATEADVAEYVARQLEDKRIGRNRQLVLRGLIELDAEADRRGKDSYAELAPVAQDEVMALAAAGHLKLGKVPSDGFVRALVVLTLEGFLGDPSYGGNKGQAGWRAIDYAAIAAGGTAHAHRE